MFEYLQYLSNNFFILVCIQYHCFSEFVMYFIGHIDFNTCINNIVNKCIRQNILFVKVFQSMTSGNILPKTIIDIFKKNTHSVVYTDDELNTELLNDVIIKYNIKLFDPYQKPFHSGMVSVAYFGEMSDGDGDGDGKKKVIVKLKRNNIANRIKQGSENVSFIYNLLCFMFYMNRQIINKLDSVKSITKTTGYLVSQCDFEKEIIAIRTTIDELKQYSICENIIVPSVYNTEEDSVSPEFIILEYLDGKFPTDICDIEERKQYLNLFVKFVSIQTWFFTYFHTDLHNGNIICIKNEDDDCCCDVECSSSEPVKTTPSYKIGIIDFGMNMNLNPEIKSSLQFFSDTMFTTDDIHDVKLSKHINRFLLEPINISKLDKQDLDCIDKSVLELLILMKKGTLVENDVNTIFEQISKKLNTPLILNMEFVLILLSMSMAQSTSFILANHDIVVLEKTFKNVYFEIME